MQNRYVGDVGDFAKYAVLRTLCGSMSAAARLGVLWYLYPDERHNSDGRHTGYLNSQIYRTIDPYLHNSMSRIVRTAKRRIAEVQRSAVLPKGTMFFAEHVVGELGNGSARKRREAFRLDWFNRAQTFVGNADIVFLDPDNGIEVRSVPRDAPRAGKYVFWNEIEALWSRGHSLVIYHHLNRTKTVDVQTRTLEARFAQRLSNPPLLRSLLFRRGSCRLFWIVGQNSHAPHLRLGIDALTNSAWKGLFEIA